MLTRLVAHSGFAGSDHRNLKAIVYGGGPMYVADVLKALEVVGPRLVQIYGQGESPMTITALSRAYHLDRSHPRWRERLGSVGLPFAGVELRVVDAEDRDLPPGEVGEVLVRGDTVMAGYWQDEEATAETLRGGWLHTGDVGALDADGFLTLRDRSKDMIISGGSNIYPREIEEVLLRHPALAEVLGGRPHARRLGRGGRGLRRAAAGSARRRGRARPALPRCHRPLQASARLSLRRGAAQEQLRQGAEDRAAQAAGGRTVTPPAQRKRGSTFSVNSMNDLWLSGAIMR